MKEIKENLNEIILVYYIFSFTLLARIIPNYTKISTNILLTNVILVLFISIVYNIKTIKFTMKEIIIYLIIALDAIIDYNFRFNNFTIQTYIYMILFAVIPIFLFARIKKIEKIFNLYGIFSIIIATLFFLDPFQNYKYSGDYMGFGYNIMLMSYIGIYINARRKKNILLKIFLLITFIEIFLFSNKGTILSIGLFTLLYEMLVQKNKIKNLLIIVIGCLLLIGANTIITNIRNIARENNIYSYSIETLYQMSTRTSSGLSGRENIWSEAQELMKKNFWLGNGAGYYRTTNSKGTYTHNIIYDIIIEYGIIMLAFICLLIFKGVIKIKQEEGSNQLLGIIFFTMWFPKLFFSSYFQANAGFWLFLIWTLTNNNAKQGEKDESKKFNN